MNDSKAILPKFDQEMASTRMLLKRVPEDKQDWPVPGMYKPSGDESWLSRRHRDRQHCPAD